MTLRGEVVLTLNSEMGNDLIEIFGFKFEMCYFQICLLKICKYSLKIWQIIFEVTCSFHIESKQYIYKSVTVWWRFAARSKEWFFCPLYHGWMVATRYHLSRKQEDWYFRLRLNGDRTPQNCGDWWEITLSEVICYEMLAVTLWSICVFFLTAREHMMAVVFEVTCSFHIESKQYIYKSVTVWWRFAARSKEWFFCPLYHGWMVATRYHLSRKQFYYFKILDAEVRRLLHGLSRVAATYALALFPTGGTLIGALRWGHVIGKLRERTNITDLDLDMIMLVPMSCDLDDLLQSFRDSFPDDYVYFRQGKSIMVSGRKHVCAVPDNHQNVWASSGSLRSALLDCYSIPINSFSMKAPWTHFVDRDFEAWYEDGQLHLESWRGALTLQHKVELADHVYHVPANPEASILLKWQNSLCH